MQVPEQDQQQSQPEGAAPRASAESTARVAQAKFRDCEDRNTVLQASLLDAQETISSLVVEVRILRHRLGLPMIGEPDYTDEEIKAAEKAVLSPQLVPEVAAAE